MEIEVIKADKNDIEFYIDNLTVAEILRVYLYRNGIDFAAWRREHPSKPLFMKIKSSDKTAKKAVSEAISIINKDLDKIAALAKKK